jgi:ABC-type multidrug transport system fused ATPase/permease subunit
VPSFVAAGNLRILRRLFGVAWEYRARCTRILALQVLLLGLNVLGLGWTGVAMDVIHGALASDVPAPRWPWGIAPPAGLSPLQTVALIAGAVALIALLRALLNTAYGFAVAELVHGEMVPTIRARVYDRLQALSFRFFDGHDSGALINRVTSDVQHLRSFVDMVLIQSLIVTLALLVYGGYMFSTHAGLCAACLASTPLLVWITLRYSSRVLPAHATMRGHFDQLVLGFSEAIHGVQVIKGFAAEPAFVADLLRRNDVVRDSQRSIFRELCSYTARADFLSEGNVAVLLLYGGLLVARGTLTVGELLVFAGLLRQFTTQIANLASIVNTLQESLIGARRVFEVLDTEPEVQRAPSTTRR